MLVMLNLNFVYIISIILKSFTYNFCIFSQLITKTIRTISIIYCVGTQQWQRQLRKSAVNADLPSLHKTSQSFLKPSIQYKLEIQKSQRKKNYILIILNKKCLQLDDPKNKDKVKKLYYRDLSWSLL